jgi:hypothetical protein
MVGTNGWYYLTGARTPTELTRAPAEYLTRHVLSWPCLHPSQRLQRPAGGYRITVYHSLHDEVAQYRTHVWVCSRCGHTIARASNRRPQPADCRRHVKPPEVCGDPLCTYHMHVAHCGGDYTKVGGAGPQKRGGGGRGGKTTLYLRHSSCNSSGGVESSHIRFHTYTRWSVARCGDALGIVSACFQPRDRSMATG